MQEAELEIESLQSKISQLRNTVYRLDCRNKLDRASEQSLRLQLKQLQSKALPKMETKYVEILKEVRVIEKDEKLQSELERQLHAAELRIDELMSEVCRGNSERGKQEDNAQRLRREIEWLKQGKARDQSEQRKMKELLEEQERTIRKYQEQLELAHRNREVVVHTNHVFPDFQSRQRHEKEVNIETVYVDRPVEKVVVVEVEKQITHFISAPRPCFNKIVQYPCSGQDEEEGGSDRDGDRWEARIEMLQGQLMGQTKQLQELVRQIGQYKAERSMMLEVIEGKNSELDRLERRVMRAFPQPNRSFGETQVGVQVSKRGDPTNQPPKVHSKGNPIANPKATGKK